MCKCRKEIQRLQSGIRVTRGRLQDMEASMEAKRRSVADREHSAQQLATDIADVSADLGSRELGRLTDEEQQEKQRLLPQIERLEVSRSWEASKHRHPDTVQACHSQMTFKCLAQFR